MVLERVSVRSSDSNAILCLRLIVKRINPPLMWLVSASRAVVFSTDYTLESLGEHLKILIPRPHL